MIILSIKQSIHGKSVEYLSTLVWRPTEKFNVGQYICTVHLISVGHILNFSSGDLGLGLQNAFDTRSLGFSFETLVLKSPWLRATLIFVLV